MMDDVLSQPVVIEEDRNWTIPVFRVKLDTGGKAPDPVETASEPVSAETAPPEKFDLSELGERYNKRSRELSDNSVVVAFDSDTVRSEVTREMYTLYKNVQNKAGRLYFSLGPRDAEVLGTSGFTTFPGIKLFDSVDLALKRAGAIKKLV
jgi:hypothetical protein